MKKVSILLLMAIMMMGFVVIPAAAQEEAETTTEEEATAEESEGSEELSTFGKIFYKKGYFLLGRPYWDMGFSMPMTVSGMAGVGAGFVNDVGFYFLGDGREVGNGLLALSWMWHGQGMVGAALKEGMAADDPNLTEEDIEQMMLSYHTANIFWLHGLMKTGEDNDSYIKASVGFGLYTYEAGILGADNGTEGITSFSGQNVPGLALGGGVWMDGIELNATLHLPFPKEPSDNYSPAFLSLELKLFPLFGMVVERSRPAILSGTSR